MGTKTTRTLFDEEFRLEKISAKKDPLERLNKHIDWEIFRAELNKSYEKEHQGAGGRPLYDGTVAKLTAIFKNFLNTKIDGLTFIMPSLKEGEEYKVSNGKIWDVKDNGDGTTTVRVSMFLKSITSQPYSVCSLEVVKK